MNKIPLIAIFVGILLWSCKENSDPDPLPTPVPAISSFEPAGAIGGSEVTITGSNFSDVLSVTIGATEATIKSVSAEKIVFIVPDGASTDKINVSTKDNSAASQDDFFVGGYWRLTNAPANLETYSTAHFQIGDDFYYGLGYHTCMGCSLTDRTALVKFDPAEEKWINQNPYPSLAATGTFYFTINDKAYVGGGHGSKSLSIDPKVYQFDHASGSWSEYSTTPEMAFKWTGLSFNGKGYIFISGGKIFEFDPQAKTWKENNPFPGIPVQSSFVIADKEYVLMEGGQWWEFAPATSTWTEKKRFAAETSEILFAFMLENRIYVGNDQDFSSYNPAMDTWTQLQSYPGQLSDNVTGFSSGGKGYAGLPEILADPVVNEVYAFEIH